MSKNEIIEEIRKLQVTERLNLITDIWDEIKEAEALEPISAEEEKILLNRLAAYRNSPGSAVDWNELKHDVQGRYDQ